MIPYASAVGIAIQTLESPLGWFAIAADPIGICSVTIGHPDEASARAGLGSTSGMLTGASRLDILEETADLIARYLEGEPVDLTEPPLSLAPMTPFQSRIVEVLRKVRYGETVSYAELAKRAGRPGAARAVGNVMRSNRIPLLIPCHRVVGSGNTLGGFSAPRGVALKQELLRMEAASRNLRVPSLKHPCQHALQVRALATVH